MWCLRDRPQKKACQIARFRPGLYAFDAVARHPPLRRGLRVTGELLPDSTASSAPPDRPDVHPRVAFERLKGSHSSKPAADASSASPAPDPHHCRLPRPRSLFRHLSRARGQGRCPLGCLRSRSWLPTCALRVKQGKACQRTCGRTVRARSSKQQQEPRQDAIRFATRGRLRGQRGR